MDIDHFWTYISGVITSSSPSPGMWLSLAVLGRLARYFGDQAPITIDRVPGQTPTIATDSPPLQARLLHQGRVLALVHDEQLAAALVALLNDAPRALGAFAETYVDLLRQHSADAVSGNCGECGQPAPCGTRLLLEERSGEFNLPLQARCAPARP